MGEKSVSDSWIDKHYGHGHLIDLLILIQKVISITTTVNSLTSASFTSSYSMKMKCKQKLCQLSKNLSASGNCNVCEDVAKEATNNHNRVDQNKPQKRVDVDFNKMIKIHEKLSKGETVDPQIVSTLLLAGVINITSQHDALEGMGDKI